MKVKSIKRICMSVIIGVVILSNVGKILPLANNHEDTKYAAYSGDGSDSTTLIREKTDRTSSYAKNLNTDLTHRIEVVGTEKRSGYGDAFNYDNCTLDGEFGSVDLAPGTYRYIRNSVYEKGYRYAYLIFTEAHQKEGWIEGLWSPDSI